MYITDSTKKILKKLEGYDFYLIATGSDFASISKETKYQNSYMFVKKDPLADSKLFYIQADGQQELVRIIDIDKFEQLRREKMKDEQFIHFSDKEINALIKSNGGHTPSKELDLSATDSKEVDKAAAERTLEMEKSKSVELAKVAQAPTDKASTEEKDKFPVFHYTNLCNYFRRKEASPSDRIVSEAWCATTEGLFYHLYYDNSKTMQGRKNAGWKFQISVDDSDQNNVAKAWDIVSKIVIKYKIQLSKVVEAGKQMFDPVKDDFDAFRLHAGKQITIYAYDEEEARFHPNVEDQDLSDWQTILQEINDALTKAQIRPSYLPMHSERLSDYISYRNDADKHGGPVKKGAGDHRNIRAGYNPHHHKNPVKDRQIKIVQVGTPPAGPAIPDRIVAAINDLKAHPPKSASGIQLSKKR